MGARWHFWIDRGGTFTDVVALAPSGELITHKLLSEDPDRYADAVIAGIRSVLEQHAGLARGAPLAPLVASVKMGTTVATNALLERKGEPLALLVTRGFADGLRIAYQNRPRIFDRHIVLPELLYREVVEIDERVGAHGDVLVPLDEAQLRQELERLRDAGLRAIAIAFLHGYRHTAHEATAARMARELGFEQVSVSHEVSPLMKWVSRGDTTVVDAYLSPILRRYVERVAAELPGVTLQFMQSGGGLAAAGRFQGKDSILSGPAGGIVGMVRTGLAAGFDRLIGFDMGGTSTDVSHFAGEDLSDLERAFETQVAGVRLRAPMLAIQTVAAGGGSILRFDGARLQVGPESAGAQPGPACYRRGGPLAVTDANLLLGKIRPERFPRVFGPNGDQPLDVAVVEQGFAALAEQVATETGRRMSPEQLAEGFVDIAVQNMANAIKQISVARGHDVTRYVLAVFGGAGGQHACRVADALGMTRVLSHPLAGVLSALGMGLARAGALRERAIEVRLDAAADAPVATALRELGASAREALRHQGVEPGRIDVLERVHLRYDGTDTAIVVARADAATMRAQFERTFRTRFAFLMPGRPLVVEAVSVEAIERSDAGVPETAPDRPRDGPPVEADRVRLFSGDRWHEAPLFDRGDLRRGDRVAGPAIVAERNQTTVVEPGWACEVTARGDLLLERVEARPGAREFGTDADPVLLEVFNNLFMSIAEQMGLRLSNTAHSVNIRERLDFSCAIFDAGGNLIANAPHIPVHLGSMGESIRTVIRENSPTMKPGDVYVLNAPYNGGTHLPDVTVITPVHDADGRSVLFYLGSRGHHADIGGTTPGSMPADSTSVDQEGVLIDNFRLVDGGRLCEDEARTLLTAGRWPVRNVEQNLADLRAQVAANAKGAEELARMVAHFGLEVVRAYMAHVQDNAEEAVRRVITALHDGDYRYELDNGAVVQVAIRVDRATRSAVVDFTGSSMQLPNNFNAPKAVAMAAVLYVFRSLVDRDIPLNAGCLKPLQVIVPEGSMLDPRFPAAVVAGNVETSSCVTQALYGALHAMAESAGSMNNLIFGNARVQYYETISGGTSAGVVRDADGRIVDGFDGTDVVQAHMTNSRLTDPEVLEWRFPVRLECYSIRRGSGGAGRWRGGNGGVRRIRVLEPMSVSILSNNRLHAPRGAEGGHDGAPGVNRIERADGRIDMLAGSDRAELEAGDTIVIETPGGGGFGAPSDAAAAR